MWLILTAFAAIFTTVIWYIKGPEDKYKIGLLCLAFWGATIMWLVDHVMAFVTEGGEFFEISRDATMLGISTIIFALIIWLAILLISDPKGVLKKALKR
jgi:hypothetical protein